MNRRKVIMMSFVALAAFGGAFLWASRKLILPSGPKKEPETEGHGLKLEPRVLDLGTVIMNRKIEFATMIQNYGQKPINLASIRPSCGCTDVSVAKRICQPGENVELTGTFVAQKSGRFRHSVTIIEDDASAPEHILEIVGEAEASISVFPESVVLSPSIFDNKAVEQVVIFRNNSDERAIIREPIRLEEGLSVRIDNREISSKQETKVIVRAEPRFFVDADVNLSFPISHSTQENVVVPVQLRPENGFTVVPNKIRLGVVSKRELEKSLVRLSLIGHGVKNVVINQVLTPPFLKMAKESTRKGDRMEMEFTFAKTLQGMAIQGVIRIDLGISAEGSEEKRTVGLKVPISGLVRE